MLRSFRNARSHKANQVVAVHFFLFYYYFISLRGREIMINYSVGFLLPCVSYFTSHWFVCVCFCGVQIKSPTGNETKKIVWGEIKRWWFSLGTEGKTLNVVMRGGNISHTRDAAFSALLQWWDVSLQIMTFSRFFAGNTVITSSLRLYSLPYKCNIYRALRFVCINFLF